MQLKVQVGSTLHHETRLLYYINRLMVTCGACPGCHIMLLQQKRQSQIFGFSRGPVAGFSARKSVFPSLES